MLMEFGIGEVKIVVYNADKLPEIDEMLLRIADAYDGMLRRHYPEMERLYKCCTIVFAEEWQVTDGVMVGVSRRQLGIYSGTRAYARQIAAELFRRTGFPILADSAVYETEIGIGDLDARSEGYVILKDALLALPGAIG